VDTRAPGRSVPTCPLSCYATLWLHSTV